MNFFLIQAIPIAGVRSEESSFWMQILVFLLLAVLVGLYSLVKSNRSKHKEQQQKLEEQGGAHYAKSRWRFQLPHKSTASQKGLVQEYIAKMKNTRNRIPNQSQEPNEPATETNKDLQSGMGLLELDFLLSMVEDIENNAPNDVTMRKLNFNEVFRRKKLSQVNSKVLTAFAINQGDLYGKDIQCKAMGQLAERSMNMNRGEDPQPTVLSRKEDENS
jgi:hypothetical protein